MLFSIQVLKRSAHRLCRGSASSPHIPRACLFVDAPQLFDPGSIQGQSKHSVQTSRKCNFDLLFPNPKSAEITQQPRHGARVGGQPSAPLRCVPLGPASGSAISPSRRALCLRPPPYLSFYRRSRGGDSGTMARRAREWAAFSLPHLCASWCSPEDQPSAHPGGPCAAGPLQILSSSTAALGATAHLFEPRTAATAARARAPVSALKLGSPSRPRAQAPTESNPELPPSQPLKLGHAWPYQPCAAAACAGSRNECPRQARLRAARAFAAEDCPRQVLR